MDEQRIKREIISECVDENGFIVKLHSHLVFDEGRYRHLYESISMYAETLGHEDIIDRSVAACLFELWTAITIALDIFAEREHPKLSRIQKAHAEVSELLHNRIFRIRRLD